MRFLNTPVFPLIIMLICVIEIKAQWKQVNLGPASGKVNAVTVVGSDVYAATIAGINKSTDGGTTWVSVYSRLTLCLTTIGSNIFGGTGYGVIYSSDDGNNWSKPDSNMSYYITALAVKDSFLFAGTEYGIYRSTNNGKSWTAVDSNLGNAQVLALTVIGINLYVGTAEGLWLSTNNGNSWANLVANNLSSLQVISCIAESGSTIFLGTPGGIIRSTDNGGTWGVAGTGINNNTSIFSILINNGNIFIGTTSSVYVSTNNGESWAALSSGLPVSPSQVYSVAAEADSTGGTNLYAGTNNGVYVSKNSGISWTAENKSTVGTEVYSITGAGSKIFAVIKDSPIFVSTDYGSTWNAKADSGLGIRSFQRLMYTGSNLYVATYDSSLFMSSNDGKNWYSIDAGVMDTLHPFNIIQSGSNLVLSTYSDGIYYSSDSGLSWQKANGNLPKSTSVLSTVDSKIFAEFAYGMYISSDSGESWVQINDFQFNGQAYVGIVQSGSTLFTANEYSPTVDTTTPPPGGLYRSMDNGITWTYDKSNNWPVNSWIFALTAHGSDVFVAPGAVLYVSTDAGQSWEHLGEAFDSYISTVFVNDSNIFVGTYDGIWQMPLSNIVSTIKESTPRSSPKLFILWQNYPNPFNPSTVISWQLAVGSSVTLKVYNVLGQVVKTLVNEREAAGTHSITFNVANLPSGIYFYRLTAGSFVQTKKLMVIK